MDIYAKENNKLVLISSFERKIYFDRDSLELQKKGLEEKLIEVNKLIEQCDLLDIKPKVAG